MISETSVYFVDDHADHSNNGASYQCNTKSSSDT